MNHNFKRSVARGFTLIELLIVVIILAILAAIAIPQFSSSTSDAQLSALDSNLATVRSAVEQYKVQHNNVYPGAAASTGAVTCPNSGTNKTGVLGTADAMQAQLQYPTNAAGQACTIAGGEFKYGPYLRTGLPLEPINNSSTVTVTTTGAPITAGTTNGWAYDTASGQFIMNSTADDKSGKTPARTFAAH